MCEMCQNGDTPLMWAAENSSLPVVAYLLKRGADVKAKNNVSDVII